MQKAIINHQEHILDTGERTEFTTIQDIIGIKDPFDKLWETAIKLYKLHEKWMNGPILEISAEEVEQEVRIKKKQVYYKSHNFNFFFKKVQTMWKLSYKLTKLFNHPEYKCPFRAAITIKTRLEKFKINLPVIQVLCNPGLKERHWKMMTEKLGIDITPKEDTSLKEMLKYDKHLEKHLEDLGEIAALASKEYALEQALKKMKNDWNAMSFNFVPYKDSNLHILSAFDDVQALLDDHIVKTTTMKNSPFVAAFEREVNIWDFELVNLCLV